MKNQEQQEKQTQKPLPNMLQQDDDAMLQRIGHVTRTLHDQLSGMGIDKALEKVASEIPDTRDRLHYVTQMTEQAAERVLNATDEATPLQNALSEEGASLKQKWEGILAQKSVKNEYDTLAKETIAYLALTDKNTEATKALLMEIMMAQDFQDLTGQVIKRVIELAQELEHQLVQVLVDFSPEVAKKAADDSLMNGPQINAEKKPDAVSNQEQVDDLLDSLGF